MPKLLHTRDDIEVWRKEGELNFVSIVNWVDSSIQEPKDYTIKNNERLITARGVMVIVVGNRHGDTSSNPGRDWLHFT